MNLYKISQNTNNGYDTYDAAIVAAESTERARVMHPANENCSENQKIVWNSEIKKWVINDNFGKAYWWQWDWAEDPVEVSVELIGMAVANTREDIVLASYHAG